MKHVKLVLDVMRLVVETATRQSQELATLPLLEIVLLGVFVALLGKLLVHVMPLIQLVVSVGGHQEIVMYLIVQIPEIEIHHSDSALAHQEIQKHAIMDLIL
jgi:hypothetical protein